MSSRSNFFKTSSDNMFFRTILLTGNAWVIFSRLFATKHKLTCVCVLFITLQGRPGVMGPQGELGLQGYAVSCKNMHLRMLTITNTGAKP